MQALTPAERRGALVVVLLLAIGAFHDLWRATHPLPPASAADPAVPAETAAADAGAPRPDSGSAPDASGRLDLNRATARDLDALPGIGPVLAGRIVAHRERYGRFTRPEDLLAVRGIGPRLFERLRPRVRATADSADTSRRSSGAPSHPGATASTRRRRGRAKRSAAAPAACRFRFSRRG